MDADLDFEIKHIESILAECSTQLSDILEGTNDRVKVNGLIDVVAKYEVELTCAKNLLITENAKRKKLFSLFRK